MQSACLLVLLLVVVVQAGLLTKLQDQDDQGPLEFFVEQNILIFESTKDFSEDLDGLDHSWRMLLKTSSC